MVSWKNAIGSLFLMAVMSSAFAQVSFNVSISSNRGHSRLACELEDTIFLSALVPSNYDTVFWNTSPMVFSAGAVTDTFFVSPVSANLTIILFAIDTNVTPHDTAIASEVIHIIGKPNPYINVLPQPNICVSSEVVFNGVFSNPVDSFFWIIDNNIISDGSIEQPYSYSTPGQDTVWLIATNVCGLDSGMVVVTASNSMSPGGIFSQVIPSQACPGAPVRFLVGPPNLTNGYDLTWDFGDGSPPVSGHISDVKEVTHFYSSTGSFTASLIVKWEGGACPNDSSVFNIPINVNTSYNPSFANIYSLDSGCVNSQFSFYLSIAAPENVEYVMWDMGDGSVYYTSSNFRVLHTYSSPGSYNVTAVVYSYCGDTVHVNKTVEVKTSGVSGYTPGIFLSSDNVCPNEQFLVYVSSSFSDSIIIAFNGLADTFATPTVLDTLIAPASIGFDTVVIYFINPCGEWDSTIRVVRISSNQPFVLMNLWSGGENHCVGDSVRVDFTTISPSIDLDTLYIDYGDGVIDTLLPLGNFITRYHVYNSPGQYMISATGVKTCLQLHQTVYDYIVISDNISPDVRINVFPMPICAGEPVYFYALSSFFMPEDQLAYTWDFGDGNMDVGRSAQHVYTEGGTYNVTLFTAACGKVDTANVKVRVIGAPAYDINASATSVCVGNSITFDAIQLGALSANELVWSFGDGIVDSGASVSHTFSSPGTYNVVLMAVGDSCSTEKSISVSVAPNVPPMANFVYNYLGNGTTQFFNLSSDATSYVWYFGDGDSSLVPNPIHTYTANGTYTIMLVAINPCGFVDTFTQTITITDLSTVDVEVAESGNTVMIYPNPVSEFLRLKITGSYNGKILFVIKDIAGKVVLSQIITGDLNIVNTASLPVGTYIGQLINVQDGALLWTGKILKGVQ